MPTLQGGCALSTIDEVEAVLHAFVGRLRALDGSQRAVLPARRTIQAHCTDLGVMYHAHWRDGQFGDLTAGPAPRADIRIEATAGDLVALGDGTLGFRDAWASQRVRVAAPLVDLLRLRAVF
jgi:hypothetical protein